MYFLPYLIFLGYFLLWINDLLFTLAFVSASYFLRSIETEKLSLVIKHESDHSCIHLVAISKHITYVCEFFDNDKVVTQIRSRAYLNLRFYVPISFNQIRIFYIFLSP